MTNELELTPELCDNLLMIMHSSDKDNLIVAAEMIRYIDVEANLPYLLILYKESTTEIRATVFMETIAEKLKYCFKTIGSDSSTMSYNEIYQELKAHKVSPTAMDYFLDKFSKTISDSMVNWGFSFLSDFKLKLIPIKNES
jgi:hypothetical protein